MTLQDEIRKHLTKYLPSSVFSYGRAFDTALSAAKLEINDLFIHLDPIETTGKASDGVIVKRVSIGFLKKDKPDSVFDKEENLEITPSVEEIQNSTETTAINWLSDFLDNYNYSDGDYTIRPITKVKNVMSGVLLTVNFSGKIKC